MEMGQASKEELLLNHTTATWATSRRLSLRGVVLKMPPTQALRNQVWQPPAKLAQSLTDYRPSMKARRVTETAHVGSSVWGGLAQDKAVPSLSWKSLPSQISEASTSSSF